MIRAIFWDNDGVLVDTERLYYRATRQVLAPAGIDLTPELYRELFLVQGRGAWHLAADMGMPADEVAQLRQRRNEIYGELLRGERLVVDGVRETLDLLRGRCLMGIVTSSRKDHLALIHRDSGLLPHFVFVVANGDYRQSKPHPEPYLKALERSGCRPDECLAVEDSRRGLISARAAGIRCAVIPTDITRGSDFAGAQAVLATVRDLPALLDELDGPR